MKREELQTKIEAELKAALAKHKGRLLTPAAVHALKREVEHILRETAQRGLIRDHWPKFVALRKKKDPGHLCIVDEGVEYDRDVWEAADAPTDSPRPRTTMLDLAKLAEARKMTEACKHATVVHGACAFCGALRCDDGTWEPPIMPGGIWGKNR